DFLWRVTEELGESYEANVLSVGQSDPDKLAMNGQHQVEELIDALHFLVELIILVDRDWKWAREQLDMSSDQLEVPVFDQPSAYWQVAYYLGMVGNTLKNKPWKQTQM